MERKRNISARRGPSGIYSRGVGLIGAGGIDSDEEIARGAGGDIAEFELSRQSSSPTFSCGDKLLECPLVLGRKGTGGSARDGDGLLYRGDTGIVGLHREGNVPSGSCHSLLVLTFLL